VSAAAPAAGRPLSGGRAGAREIAGLLFTGEMYGVQVDQLATVLGTSQRRARAAARRWEDRGWARLGLLGPGPAWAWLTRAGLAACGLPYRPTPPALARLAHIRAVTAVRLALESAGGYARSRAYWRSERRLRARLGNSRGGRLGLREHVPDGEVHWPDGAPVAWAGEIWAIEAELTPKPVARTVAIMRELLSRTGDYGCPAAQVRVAGLAPRHLRVVYLCAPRAVNTVATARAALGGDAARIEIRPLPRAAALPPGGERTTPRSSQRQA
jgi:hypothetical protein